MQLQAHSETLDTLHALEKKIRWLATWTVHNANQLRPNLDGIKVGGHQASSASLSTVMTALYFNVLRPEDRVAVKPHASPNFHAIQYLCGKQTREKLERFRGLGGLQSYPSRTKDTDEVDFSTGSVGLGVAVTLFASLVQDYVRQRTKSTTPPGRMISLLGDAELDEGNIFESLLEGWKYDVRNVWWIIDYNRQSLDGVVNDDLFERIQQFFEAVGWEVVTLKYGFRQQRAFEGPAGPELKRWIDEAPNQLYSALTFKGGTAWRERLAADLANADGIEEFLATHSDDDLQELMCNLGGHDMELLLDAFHGVQNDTPRCFVAYTIKGYGLPFAGHKDNHSGQLSAEQMEQLRALHDIRDGHEWDRFEGLDLNDDSFAEFLASVPFMHRKQCVECSASLPSPAIPAPKGTELSTQEAFGRIMTSIGRADPDFADRIVTACPDVTTTTNLTGWVNQRGVYRRDAIDDTFREEEIASPANWERKPDGQHMELGIAENNLFVLLAALGMSDSLFDHRLIPIGAIYDVFIGRGLDALNYACYQDARFLLIGTPSGVTLSSEGGAHQSIYTPLLGIGQDKLTFFEPGYADELACMMEWAFHFMQQPDGESVYLRLSTRALSQPERELDDLLKSHIIDGAYWLREPEADCELAIIYEGVVAPEALQVHERVLQDIPGVGVLAITSPDRLYRNWLDTNRGAVTPGETSHIESLLSRLAPNATLVTMADGHPTALGWLGGVRGDRVVPLGVRQFGQSGALQEVYGVHGLDVESVLDAVADRYAREYIKES